VVDSGDRRPFVRETLLSDDRATIGKKSTPAPRWLGEALAFVLERVGPKGLEFARYSIEYHTLRNFIYVQRTFRPEHARRHVPQYSKRIFDAYDQQGELSQRAKLTSWEEEEAGEGVDMGVMASAGVPAAAAALVVAGLALLAATQ